MVQRALGRGPPRPSLSLTSATAWNWFMLSYKPIMLFMEANKPIMLLSLSHMLDLASMFLLNVLHNHAFLCIGGRKTLPCTYTQRHVLNKSHHKYEKVAAKKNKNNNTKLTFVKNLYVRHYFEYNTHRKYTLLY